ncbi:Gfo/Idh/MocA family protein [Oligoflexus tunisiensis]|uniref:Gfo/Idh/MocA family protein n=1 Tax=Oligoflexus tunisiensis TaxID=708132 RepID=UPI00114CFD3B|nr:Gfo/Idh/MocA family oxidoreductase [Oligoflexus tunisiensis]
MTVTPLILGTGRAGHAIAKSLACLKVLHPGLGLEMPVWLERDASLAHERKKYEKPLLCIANPHGLHAATIRDAARSGFPAILCEKPACVNLDELHQLRDVKTPTAILHVYRQTWGLQTLRHMLMEGEFGTVIAIEGRYWQASTAERALTQEKGARTWKDDISLAGAYDVYLDIATHWVDAVSFLFGHAPTQVRGWRSFINSDSPHRDSHVQLMLQYPNAGRAMGSISKTIHGATNHFEVNVLGSQRSATWTFERPDEIFIGEGRDRRVLTRKDTRLGSGNPPHHGMGWLEGYIEITGNLIRRVFHGETRSYPELQETLKNLQPMLQAEWFS